MTVAVTGAAGYIGSHVARLLQQRGTAVLAVDDLSSGLAHRVAGFPLVTVDVARDDAPAILAVAFADHQVDAVVHLAARKQVGESVAQPARYFHQNIAGLANVITGAAGAGVGRFVFSSSAAVYGAPPEDDSATGAGLIDEDAATLPINPYGQTKLAGEWLVAGAAAAYDVRATSLRYFNVAGAGWPELGDVVTANLVPIVLDRVAAGAPTRVHGADYATPDGTCIRDYVHVADLASAHLRALDALVDGPARHEVYNVGTGTGASVLEVIAAVQRVLGREVPYTLGPRRPGDPPRLVADVSRIANTLGWRAEHDLDDIVSSAVAAARHVSEHEQIAP